jgi:hypothetical protein
MKEYKKLDTHSSMINNQRIITMLAEIDRYAIKARKSKNFHNINDYFDVLDQLYINVKDIFDKDVRKKIEDVRKDFIIKTDRYKETEKGFRLLIWLLRKATKFNGYLITGLQKDKQFFFRQSSYNSDLDNTAYFEDSVFTVQDEKEDEEEDDEEELFLWGD